MTKKQIVIGIVLSVLLNVLVFAFAAYMESRARMWAAEHRMLTDLVRLAVDLGNLINDRPLAIALIVIGFIFGLVWMVGLLWKKKGRAA